MPYFFGTFPLTSGVTTFANIGASGIAGCLIGNESGLTCLVTMQGNNLTKSLYPGSVDFFPVGPGFTGVVQIVPSTQLSNISSWPGQFVQIDVYGSSEQPSGVYPLQLARANNIGNSITTSAGVTADTLVNDGSSAGTEFVEATVSGDASSAVSLKNNGILTLGNSTRTGGITTEGGSIFVNGAGSIGGAGLLYSTLVGGFGLSIAGKASLDNGSIFTDGAGGITTGGITAGAITSGAITETGAFSVTTTDQVTFNGPTAGSVTIYLVLRGSIKLMICKFSGYQNNTASQQTFTFPSSLTINGPSFWISSDIPGCQGFLSGVGNTINIITALVAGGGTITNQNNINKNSFGYHQSAATDSLKDTINDATGTHTGQLIAIGF